MMRLTTLVVLTTGLAWGVVHGADWRYTGSESAAPQAPATQPAATSVVAMNTNDQPAEPAHTARSDMPTNNMSADKVRAKFGEPDSEIPPVGQPPIMRWLYPTYIVYFEWDRVIISVPKDI